MKRILIGLAAVGVVVLGGCAQQPERDASGAIVDQEDNADIFAVKLGDCLAETAEDEELDRVKAIPCTDEHAAEVYAEKQLPKGAFPGRAGLDKAVEEFCVPEFDEFVGMSFEESKLDIFHFEPTPESWGIGDRKVQCLVEDPKGKVKGSMKGAKR